MKMMTKLSLLALALSAVFPLATQAAMTFTPGAQPATAPTFSGTMAVPQYQIAWRWGTNNISAISSSLLDMTSSEKVLTLQGASLPTVTLLTGYTPFGVQTNQPPLARVVWSGAAGAPVTTAVVGQERYIRKITAPILQGGAASGNVKIGSADLYISGAVAALGTNDYKRDVTSNSNYYVAGLLNINALPSTLCGDMMGSGKGLVAASATASSGATPAGFDGIRTRLQVLLDNAQGVTSAPLPAAGRPTLDYLNAEIARVSSIAAGGAPLQTAALIATNVTGDIFMQGMAGTKPDMAIEFRCAVGFSGMDANEKIVLTFDNSITATTEWRIVLTPTVTYS